MSGYTAGVQLLAAHRITADVAVLEQVVACASVAGLTEARDQLLVAGEIMIEDEPELEDAASDDDDAEVDLGDEDEIENGVLSGTGTTIKGIDSHQLAVDAINSRIVDFAIADELVAKFLVEKNPDLAALPLYYSGPTREEDYPVEESYAIAVNRDRTDLLEAFNEVLGEMLTTDSNGKTEIDRLILKYTGLENE